MADRLVPPRAVLFDWDGTLVDNWDVIHRALNDTFAAFGMPVWSREEAMARISASQRDSFPVLFGGRWEAARDLFYDRFAARHLEELRVLPGAVDLLDALDAAAMPIAVVSNKSGRFLRLEVGWLGWNDRFLSLVGAGDAEADKPAAAPVHLALAGAAVSAGPDVWLVGDSPTDVATARNAGCTAVLVRQGAGNPEALPSGLAPDVKVASLLEVATLAGAMVRAI